MYRLNIKFLIVVLTFIVFFIIITILFLNLQERLYKAETLLRKMSSSNFSYTLNLTDSLKVTSNFNVLSNIPVHVQMPVVRNVHFVDTLLLNEVIRLPIKMQFKSLIPIDTTFFIPHPISIYIDDTLHIQQSIRLFTGKTELAIPVNLIIPFKQNISVSMHSIPIKSTVPVNFVFNDTLETFVSLSVPLNFEIPINFQLSERAIIGFYEPLPISGNIPLNINIPINIPLSKTLLGLHLDSLSYLLKFFNSSK